MEGQRDQCEDDHVGEGRPILEVFEGVDGCDVAEVGNQNEDRDVQPLTRKEQISDQEAEVGSHHRVRNLS